MASSNLYTNQPNPVDWLFKCDRYIPHCAVGTMTPSQIQALADMARCHAEPVRESLKARVLTTATQYAKALFFDSRLLTWFHWVLALIQTLAASENTAFVFQIHGCCQGGLDSKCVSYPMTITAPDNTVVGFDALFKDPFVLAQLLFPGTSVVDLTKSQSIVWRKIDSLCLLALYLSHLDQPSLPGQDVSALRQELHAMIARAMATPDSSLEYCWYGDASYFTSIDFTGAAMQADNLSRMVMRMPTLLDKLVQKLQTLYPTVTFIVGGREHGIQCTREDGPDITFHLACCNYQHLQKKELEILFYQTPEEAKSFFMGICYAIHNISVTGCYI
jgi:hypothetical protein